MVTSLSLPEEEFYGKAPVPFRGTPSHLKTGVTL